MINAFIDRIPDNQLSSWSWWLTFVTILVPALAAVVTAIAGYGAMKVNDRISLVTTSFRTITPKQRSQFVAFLAPSPKGKVKMSVTASDREAFAFASQVRDMIREAGYETPEIMNTFISAPPLIGILIKVKSESDQPPFGGPIQKAFKAINIDTPGKVDSSVDANTVLIQVGLKP
jgi:hypothetical protein